MQNDIEAIRTDLARWSAGKPKAVRNAVANLDGWLAVCEHQGLGGDCTRDATVRAVETLRSAVRDCPAAR